MKKKQPKLKKMKAKKQKKPYVPNQNPSHEEADDDICIHCKMDIIESVFSGDKTKQQVGGEREIPPECVDQWLDEIKDDLGSYAISLAEDLKNLTCENEALLATAASMLHVLGMLSIGREL